MSESADLARRCMAARPRLVAALAARLRDLDAAEDAFGEAMEACLALDTPPDRLEGWLMTVARRKAIDAIRKEGVRARASEAAALIDEGGQDMGDVIELPEAIPDERLRLIFICCHPAIGIEARTALALKVVCGLSVNAIARVFLTSEPTMYQRITRAKTKVREAGIAFELPDRRHWGERLEAVLLTIELAYTAAYQDAAGEIDPELSAEMGRLASMIADLLPEEPEALALASLVMLARSREGARLDEIGAMIPLSKQDTSRWDLEAMEQARRWMDRAALHERSGPYQVMAAIQLTHARRAFGGETDWRAILSLYDVLLQMRPGPMVALNRALALAEVEGAARALEALGALPTERLRNARALHVARAHLLSRTGDHAAAGKALDTALALGPPQAERLFLERRRIELAQT